MKTSKYIYSFMLAVALAFAGCSDFLDSEDNSNIAGDNFYQTEDDFRAATAPLYNKVWFDFNDKFYYGLVMDADSTFVRQPLIISILLPI